MTRSKKDRHPDAVNLTAYGRDWNEIQDEARRIACMPGGRVTMANPDGGGLWNRVWEANDGT